MAFREKPPHGLLKNFSNPLWQRLGLLAVRPQWIVKGQHREYEWMAIELTHNSTGFREGLGITTVFVVWLPRPSEHWYLPADRITPTRQVCVDDTCVYAAALNEQPRVRTWRQWLDLAVDTAEEVIRTEGARREESPQQAAERADEASWNPGHVNFLLFWLGLMLLFGFFNVWGLVEAYLDWQGHGAILQWDPKTHRGTYLQGWKALAYVAALSAPLLLAAKAAYTMATRMHRPGFLLQLNVEGLLWAAAMYGLFHAQQALTASVRQAC